MQLIVMRHGEAEGFTVNGDAQRNLTHFGNHQALVAGKILVDTGVAIDELWVSPYNRAQQTAAAVMTSLPVPETKTLPGLTPDSSVNAVADLIARTDIDKLMIVSHQPLVGELIASLSGVSRYAVPMMATASMVLLEAEDVLPGCFNIVWQRHSPDFVKSF